MPIKTRKTVQTNDVLTILDQYMREHDTVSAERTRYAVKALKRFFVGMTVESIDIPLCRQYVAFRMDEGVAMSTIARELTVLRAACNHAYKWKRITNDQRPVFEIPTNLPKRDVWLLKGELTTLMDAACPVLASFIKIAYGTASRRRAVETLEWSQCDLHRRTISLAKRGEPATNKRRPTVPMAGLFPLFEELYADRTNQWVLGSSRDLLYDFSKLCESVDLLYVPEHNGRPSGKITPHVLRHSRATHLLEDGVSIYAVGKLLGDSVMTVQKTYGHIQMSSLEDELGKSVL